MSLIKVKINYVRHSDSELELLTADVHTKLNGNKNFVLPEGLLIKLEAARLDFRNKIIASTEGGKVQLTERNSARLVVLDLMRETASYVNILAMGDRAKLESSGFTLTDERTTTKLEAPEFLLVEPTKIPGQLRIRVRKPPYPTKGMIIKYIIASEDGDIIVWEYVVVSKHNFILEGLKSRVLYKVAVSYIGTNEEKPVWSKEVIVAPI